MEVTKKQREISEIAVLIAYCVALAGMLIFIHNMIMFICFVVIALLAFITDMIIGISRSNTIRNELIKNKDNNINEIKRLVNNGSIEGITSLQADTVLNILKSSKTYHE